MSGETPEAVKSGVIPPPKTFPLQAPDLLDNQSKSNLVIFCRSRMISPQLSLSLLAVLAVLLCFHNEVTRLGGTER